MAATPLRVFAAVLLLGTALVVQLTGVARLGLPGAPPNLLVVTLTCLALTTGPLAGAVAGFCAGLVGDLLSVHVVGRYALVLTVGGYLAGLLASDDDRGALVPLVAVGVAGSLAGLGYAGLGFLLGDRVTPTSVAAAAGLSALYDVLLTPFVFPTVRAVLVRAGPERD